MSTQTMRVTLAAKHALATPPPSHSHTNQHTDHSHVYSTQQTGPLTLAAFAALAQHAQTTQHDT